MERQVISIHRGSFRGAAGIAFCLVLAAFLVRGEPLFPECPPPNSSRHEFITTDQLSLELESAAGAEGDVVGVSVLLRSQIPNPGSMVLAICHDPTVAELEGEPAYSDDLVQLLGAGGVLYYDVGPHLPFHNRGNGCFMIIDLTHYRKRFPSDVPLNLMTIYYRLKGRPGDAGPVTFCDGALERNLGTCIYNDFAFSAGGGGLVTMHYLPAAPVNGVLTVLDGPATHPERPPEPPKAKVYPELPSLEAINFRVRVTGARARPGDRQVPVEVYVSADVEYSSIEIPIDFDERYLRVARAEDHFLAGVVLTDNRDDSSGAGPEEGHAVIYSGAGLNTRRLATEGEEVHAATLHFDVLEAAREIRSTPLTVVKVTDSRGVTYPPWVGIRHLSPAGSTSLPIRSEVGPFDIQNGALAILPDITLFVRGDSSDDGRLDLTDAQFTLSFLFLGSGPPNCMDAADVNDDGRLDVSDPIAFLGSYYLGLGEISPPRDRPGEDPTPDALGCYQ